MDRKLPYDIEMIYLLQEGRQREFPSDRIAWFRDVLGSDPTPDVVWEIAEEDMKCFNDYEVGAITLEILCTRIAKNNFLDRVFKKGIPKDMMLNELHEMGWAV